MISSPFIKKNGALVIILLVAASFSAASLGNGFSIDDGPLLVVNKAVHGFSTGNLRTVLTSVSNGLEFLPVRDLTYMLDHQVWGLNPFGYHLSNLLWYVACCAVFYIFLARLLMHWTDHFDGIAFIAALLFAVHPVHVESVAGIAQRKDLVSGFLFFCSLITYLRFQDSGQRRFYGYSLMAFSLALLAKGTVVVLPLIIVMIELLRPGKQIPAKQVFLRAIPFIMIMAAVTIPQAALLKQGGFINESYLAFGRGYERRIYSSFRAIMHYIQLLLIPYPLTILHTFQFSHRLLELPVLLSMAGTGIITVFAYRLRMTAPAFAFALASFLILLLPVIGLVPLATVISERYLFLPSAAFCLMAAIIIHKGATRESLRYISYGSLVAIVLVFMAVSINRSGDWKDALTLYEAGIRTNPESPRLRWLAGRELFEKGQYPEAFRRLDEARLLDRWYAVDYVLFTALLALERNEPDKALSEIEAIHTPQNDDIFDLNVIKSRALIMKGNQDGRRFLQTAKKSRIRLGIVSRRSTDELMN